MRTREVSTSDGDGWVWSSRIATRRCGRVGETVKSANRWFLFSGNPAVPATDRQQQTKPSQWKPLGTWSHTNGFAPLLHIRRIDPQIPKVREIHHTAICDRSSPSVLLHARSCIPPRSEKIFFFSRVDNHATPAFAGPSFNVVDG